MADLTPIDAMTDNERLRRAVAVLRQALASCDKEARQAMAQHDDDNRAALIAGLVVGLCSGALFGGAAVWWLG